MYMLDLDVTTLRTLKIRDNCERIINYMIEYKPSLRIAEENLGMSKSNIHKYIHTYIKTDYNDDYVQIVNILRYNAKFRRRSRKYWRK